MISGRRIIKYLIIGLCGAEAVAFGASAIWFIFAVDNRELSRHGMALCGVIAFVCGAAAVELFRSRGQCE